jgi:hypothetical protein
MPEVSNKTAQAMTPPSSSLTVLGKLHLKKKLNISLRLKGLSTLEEFALGGGVELKRTLLIMYQEDFLLFLRGNHGGRILSQSFL